MTRIAMLAAVAASSLALGCCDDMSFHAGPGATAVQEIAVDPGEATALSVETSAGNIQVGPALKVRGSMMVQAKKHASTEADLAHVHPFARVEGDVIRVGYTVDPGVKGVGVSFTLQPVEVKSARLKTSAGNVKVDGIHGDLVISTSAGNVDVAGADGSVDAVTSAGNVEVSGRLRGKCRLESSAGNLTARIPADIRMKVDGRTSAGNAKSELAVAASSRYASATIAGALGDGSDGTLEMRTSAGNLALRKLP
jgi:DUF4097 and DUF4098 domain-containing protein YvlB